MKPALRPVSLLLALPLAAPPQVSGGSEVDFNSRYVWRGIACSDGPVLQANDWVSARGFTLNGWANLVLTQEPQQGEVNSVSASLTYDKEYAGFRLEPLIEYWADRRIARVADPATGELSLNISRSIGPVRVFLLQTVDAFRFRGAAYSETGITRSFAWRGIKTDSTARVGWANREFMDAYVRLPKGALLDAGVEIASTIPVFRTFYVKPHCVWTYLPERRVRQVLRPASLWDAGIAFGVTF